jgi:hypothetical protein
MPRWAEPKRGMSVMKYNKINIFSVPHTGTCFMRQFFDKNHIEHESEHYGLLVGKRKALVGGPGILTVSPIREPYMQWISFHSRQTDFVDYRTSWLLFNERFLMDQDLFILPVDTPDRHKYLNKLEERIGKKLTTDWKPVGGGARKELELPDLTWLYELPVVKKYYENPNSL